MASHDGRPSREAMGVHGHRFGLWAWHLEAHTMAKQSSEFYILVSFFSPFLWVVKKFGHSVPRPLDLDGHSVKRSLVPRVVLVNP